MRGCGVKRSLFVSLRSSHLFRRASNTVEFDVEEKGLGVQTLLCDDCYVSTPEIYYDSLSPRKRIEVAQICAPFVVSELLFALLRRHITTTTINLLQQRNHLNHTINPIDHQGRSIAIAPQSYSGG